MKKLMIAAAIVCAAAVSEAAMAAWSSGDVSYDEGSKATSGGTAIADGNWGYFFVLNANQYATLTDGLAAQSDVQAFTKSLFEAAVLDNSSYDTSTLTVGSDTIYSTDAATYAGGVYVPFDVNEYDPGKFYAAIITTVEEDGKVVAYTASAVEATATALSTEGDGAIALRWGASDSGIASEWVAQSVPEPTSGLLLLLGVAGLALRRRRA